MGIFFSSAIPAPTKINSQGSRKICVPSGKLKSSRLGFTWELEHFETLFEPPVDTISSPDFCVAVEESICTRYLMLCAPKERDYVSLGMIILNKSSVDKTNSNLRNMTFRAQFHLTATNEHDERVTINDDADHLLFSYHQDRILLCRDFIRKDVFVAPNEPFSSKTLRLKNINLKIFCEGLGTSVRSLPPNQELYKPAVYGILSRTVADFESLYKNGLMSDFVIRLDDGSEFRVHKVILAARSEIFASAFARNLPEIRDNVLEIKDARREVVDKLLQYIYCGRVKDIDDVNLELLILARQYLMMDLQEACEISILESLTIENASELLVIADKHNAYILAEKAIDFINQHAERVISTKSYENMSASRPDLVVKLFKNQIECHLDKDVSDEFVMVEYSPAEEAFFMRDDLRRDFAASDHKPGKR